jgi:hypothetical protein
VSPLEDAHAGFEEGFGGGEKAESAIGEHAGVEDGVEGREFQGSSYRIAVRTTQCGPDEFLHKTGPHPRYPR